MAGTSAIVACFMGLFFVGVVGILAAARVKITQIEQQEQRRKR